MSKPFYNSPFKRRASIPNAYTANEYEARAILGHKYDPITRRPIHYKVAWKDGVVGENYSLAPCFAEFINRIKTHNVGTMPIRRSLEALPAKYASADRSKIDNLNGVRRIKRFDYDPNAPVGQRFQFEVEWDPTWEPATGSVNNLAVLQTYLDALQTRRRNGETVDEHESEDDVRDDDEDVQSGQEDDDTQSGQEDDDTQSGQEAEHEKEEKQDEYDPKEDDPKEEVFVTPTKKDSPVKTRSSASKDQSKKDAPPKEGALVPLYTSTIITSNSPIVVEATTISPGRGRGRGRGRTSVKTLARENTAKRKRAEAVTTTTTRATRSSGSTTLVEMLD